MGIPQKFIRLFGLDVAARALVLVRNRVRLERLPGLALAVFPKFKLFQDRGRRRRR